jgi:ribosomal protein S18 acetylase RimI-like enzyme
MYIPNQQVEIVHAAPSDSAGILACLAAAFEPYRESYTEGALLDTILTPETFRNRLVQMKILVAKTPSRQIVGTIACEPLGNGEGHLRGMAVVPEFLGSGLAQRLLETAEQELHRAGCKVVTLDTTKPLQRAIRFYEKNGYHATGKVQDFFGMPLHEYSKSL